MGSRLGPTPPGVMPASAARACISGSPSHPASLASSSTQHLSDTKFRELFNDMRLSGEMCDVAIHVEDTSLPAHKLILAGCSSYFRAMFRSGHFDESQMRRVRIDPQGELGIRATAVEQLIVYMYTGKIDLSHHHIIDLIRAADHFQMTQIRNEALRLIEDHISFDTYLEIRDVGNVFNSPRLLKAVDKFIRKNFAQFVHSQAFLDLNEPDLVNLLKHNHLRTETEEVVFDALLRWCRYNDKWGKFCGLANFVRYDLISFKYILKSIRDDHDVRSRADVTNFLLDSIQSMSSPVLHTVSRPRFSTEVLVAMPYRSRTFYLITFYGGDYFEFNIKHFPEMIHDHIDALINYNVCKMLGKYLYMAGGTGYTANNEPFHSNRAFVYDVIRDQWKRFTALPTESTHFGMAALDSRILLVSGGEASEVPAQSTRLANSEVQCLELDSASSLMDMVDGPDQDAGSPEQYARGVRGLDWSTPAAHSWRPVASMNYQRACVKLCAVGRNVYAIGGMLDGGYTPIVERYDVDLDAWSEVDSMSQGRCNPGVVVAGGKIYVVGGLGDNLLGPSGALKSVEYYDPESDTWTSLPDMYFARHSPAVAYVNNRLFVFGGGSPTPLLRPGPERTVECFDFERHEWFVLQTKIPGRSNAVYVSSYFDHLDA